MCSSTRTGRPFSVKRLNNPGCKRQELDTSEEKDVLGRLSLELLHLVRRHALLEEVPRLFPRSNAQILHNRLVHVCRSYKSKALSSMSTGRR